MSEKAKVIVGLSGGVDSSVAALLLQQQGYDVEGLFMKNWEEDDDQDYCSAAVDLADAQAVADRLSIPLHNHQLFKRVLGPGVCLFFAGVWGRQDPQPGCSV